MDSDYLSAVATMEEGIENNISLTTKNLTTLGTLYERINTLERAIKTFEKLHINHPNNIQIGLMLANFYTFTEQKDKALDYISTLTNQQQNHSAVLALKGKALYHQKKYQEALPFLLESYEKNNNNKLMSYIFDCQIRLNNNDLAIEAMAKHLESNPGAVNNKIVYANELRKVDSQLAIVQYKEIIEKDVRNIVALNNLAWLFYEQGKLIEAKKYIDQAILYYPNNIDVIDTLNKINSAMN
jgi:tetratricopeptide (TPR) repeat protein